MELERLRVKIIRLADFAPSYDSLLQGFKNSLELKAKGFMSEEEALQALVMAYAPELLRKLNDILDRKEGRDVPWSEIIAELNRIVKYNPQEKSKMFEYLKKKIKPEELNHYVKMAKLVMPFTKKSEKR